MKTKIVKPLLLLIMVLFACEIVISCSSVPQTIAGKPGHHTTEGFQNNPYHISSNFVGAPFVFRRVWYSFFPKDEDINHQLTEEESLEQLFNSNKNNTLTWLGHASFLVRLDGKNILTDPHLTGWAGPIEGVGPKRYTPPGISIENLPPVDIIVISHNHYDHLSKHTLERLSNKANIDVVVPLGMKPFFLDIGYTRITELDWHESVELDSIKLSAMPAVHHSGRGLFDKNEMLWASWVIQSQEKKLFFAGDTAYSESIFRNIGEKHGPFDWALVPIGAYSPTELLKQNHVDPVEAVQLGSDIQATNLVAMHWGTFNLSDEPLSEPPSLFEQAGERLGYSAESLWVMKIGETRHLNSSSLSSVATLDAKSLQK